MPDTPYTLAGLEPTVCVFVSPGHDVEGRAHLLVVERLALLL
jgi:hypothetical protein